jgi:hypothetical protein
VRVIALFAVALLLISCRHNPFRTLPPEVSTEERKGQLKDGLMKANEIWVDCARDAATRFSASAEVPSEVAEAALGECLSLENDLRIAHQAYLMEGVTNPSVQSHVIELTEKSIKSSRSNVKGGLMSLVIKLRLEKSANKKPGA